MTRNDMTRIASRIRFRAPVLLLLFAALGITASPVSAGGGPGSGGRQGVSPGTQGVSPGTMETVPHVVIVKFASYTRSALGAQGAQLPLLSVPFLRYGVYRSDQMYPRLGNCFAPDGREIGLDRMYRVEYASNENPAAVARELAAIPGVEYAEPERVHYIVYTPDDALYAQQYALERIHAAEAWEITKGSSDVIVGVVDTGVQWLHEDLVNNLYINPGEDADKDGRYTLADLNKVDDDGNGYVDDIVGIDFAGASGADSSSYYDNDPLPTETGNDHGTHVAGIIAGVGNNAKGIAGVAFRCRYLPVKCGTDDGSRSLIRPYDGIVYAAMMGAKVINCSWGGAGGLLQSETDRIDYALSRGAVVVAAAGNDASNEVFTPAAYPNVLSVASTGVADRASGFTNYATWVSVCAPGDGVLSTISATNSSYASYSGTSMASPVVAGVVALVASQRADLSPRQLAEQVRISADNVDTLQAGRYARKIGFGRVNAFRALTVTSPSVRLTAWSLSDSAHGNGNSIVDRGETLELRMRWKNHLAPTTNAVVTISSPNSHVTLPNPQFTIGALGTGAEIGNESAPFLVRMADEEALNETVEILFTITDGSYEDYGGVQFYQQPTYRDHNANAIVTTISNDGNIGYDDFTTTRGSGFVYNRNGYNVLFEGAVMIGATRDGAPVVVDVARDESGSRQSTDLIGTTPVVMRTPGSIAAQQGSTDFSDDAAPLIERLGVRVHLDSYEFTEPNHDNFVILKYSVRNSSKDTLRDLHVGLYFDWDISSSAWSDLSNFDTTTLTAHQQGIGSVPTVVGMTVLTREHPVHFVSINNPDSDGNPPVFGVHNGFTKEEKWRSMSSGIFHPMSSITDASQVIGNGPFFLLPGDTAVAAFALSAGVTTAHVIKATPFALDMWRRITTPTAVHDLPQPARMSLEVYPSPLSLARGRSVTAVYSLASAAELRLQVIDILGREVAAITTGMESAGPHARSIALPRLAPGRYSLLLRGGEQHAAVPLLVLP